MARGRRIRSEATSILATRLSMSNIFQYEADIEACNERLLKTLTDHAGTGDLIKMSDLIASYAYEVYVVTSDFILLCVRLVLTRISFILGSLPRRRAKRPAFWMGPRSRRKSRLL